MWGIGDDLRSVSFMSLRSKSAEYPFLSKIPVKDTVLSHICAALLAAFCMVAWAVLPASAGETRTLSLYQVHTKENLTVTYKKNGRYISSAMKKINHILRDWRRNKATRMDPKTVDLMWELHADLGSKRPIHIISGYRSASTNAMLRRIGRKVARRSRHIRGQAIDLYFPDVATSRVRNSALVRKIGGVGYYPRSGKSGFVHIDTGNVRHWPRISKTRMAKIFRNNRKTIGARRYRKGASAVMVASAGPTTITPKALRKFVAKRQAAVPTPRPRPLEVLMASAAAANDLQIIPASAPVPTKNFGSAPATIRDNYAPMTASLGDMIKRTFDSGLQTSNRNAKGSFAQAIRNGTAANTPTVRPLVASSERSADDEKLWWPMRLFASSESLFRRDGSPQPFTHGTAAASFSETDEVALQRMISSLASDARIDTSSTISAKADRLVVNRTGKGDLVAPAALPVLKRRSSILNGSSKSARLTNSADTAILMQGTKPLSFQ